MGLFSRKKDRDDAADDARLDDDVATDTVEDVDGDERVDEVGTHEGSDVADDTSTDEDEGTTPRRARREPVTVDRSQGPFDRSEVDDLGERLDLGALAIAPRPGSELRLDVDERGQNITGVTLVMDDSAVQMQAFAAPKSSGVWDDIRDEISSNLVGAGGTADEVEGELGLELRARMPAQSSDGRTTYTPVRFVGVDGPRWFLRAVLTGRAAVEDDVAAEMMEVVRGTVVVRGGEARAPRELLELSIPQELQQMAEEGAEDEGEDPAQNADDLKPFERGPEIIEVR